MTTLTHFFSRRRGAEKELAFFFRFLRAAAVAARLRHVIAPFFIELRQLIEFLLEIVVDGRRLRFGWRVRIRRIRQFFQHRIRFHFLLNEIAEFQQWRLKNKQTLLELRGKDLLQREILRLMHSRAGHTLSLLAGERQASRLPAPSLAWPVI